MKSGGEGDWDSRKAKRTGEASNEVQCEKGDGRMKENSGKGKGMRNGRNVRRKVIERCESDKL